MTICFAGKVFSAMNPRTTTSLTRSAVCCKVIHHPVEFGARLASAGDAQVDVLAMNVPDEPLSEFPSSASCMSGSHVEFRGHWGFPARLGHRNPFFIRQAFHRLLDGFAMVC